MLFFKYFPFLLFLHPPHSSTLPSSSPLFRSFSLLASEVATLFRDLGPESWIQTPAAISCLHDLAQVRSPPWASVPFASRIIYSILEVGAAVRIQ